MQVKNETMAAKQEISPSTSLKCTLWPINSNSSEVTLCLFTMNESWIKAKLHDLIACRYDFTKRSRIVSPLNRNVHWNIVCRIK